VVPIVNSEIFHSRHQGQVWRHGAVRHLARTK
jgi:hypothetical protein